MIKRFLKKNGFIAIELLLATSILVIFFVAFAGIIALSSRNYENVSNREEAILLAEEGLEAIRSIRDADYNLLIDGSYGISNDGKKWHFLNNGDDKGIFLREIKISSVDFGRKQVSSTVTWSDYGQKKTVFLISYLTDWRDKK